MFPDFDVLTLVLITLVAAGVNGALGHGFSSITVPVGLLFYTNRILNPALVLLEVAINSYVLFTSRTSVPAVWRRVLPIFAGLFSAFFSPRRRLVAALESNGYYG